VKITRISGRITVIKIIGHERTCNVFHIVSGIGADKEGGRAQAAHDLPYLQKIFEIDREFV
jgi:hypothetical protein